jgi:hypothetical protein
VPPACTRRCPAPDGDHGNGAHIGHVWISCMQEARRPRRPAARERWWSPPLLQPSLCPCLVLVSLDVKHLLVRLGIEQPDLTVDSPAHQTHGFLRLRFLCVWCRCSSSSSSSSAPHPPPVPTARREPVSEPSGRGASTASSTSSSMSEGGGWHAHLLGSLARLQCVVAVLRVHVHGHPGHACGCWCRRRDIAVLDAAGAAGSP